MEILELVFFLVCFVIVAIWVLRQTAAVQKETEAWGRETTLALVDTVALLREMVARENEMFAWARETTLKQQGMFAKQDATIAGQQETIAELLGLLASRGFRDRINGMHSDESNSALWRGGSTFRAPPEVLPPLQEKPESFPVD